MQEQVSTPTTALERYTAIGAGLPLLLIAMSLLGWGVRLTVAGLRSDAAWPPGLQQLLFPIALTALIVGIGGWRLLLIALPPRIAGVALGRIILAGFGVAALAGALI